MKHHLNDDRLGWHSLYSIDFNTNKNDIRKETALAYFYFHKKSCNPLKARIGYEMEEYKIVTYVIKLGNTNSLGNHN